MKKIISYIVVLTLIMSFISLYAFVFLSKKETHTNPSESASTPSLSAWETSIPAETVEKAASKESTPFPFWTEHLPQMATYEGEVDAYLICTDSIEMNQGSHYAAYSLEGEQLVPWENHSFSSELSILGQKVHCELEYGVKDEKMVLTHTNAPQSGSEVRFFHDTSQGIHRVLIGVNLTLQDGRFLHYPVYLDLETGEATDFLKEMDQKTVYEVFSEEIYPLICLGEESFLFARQDDNTSFHYFYMDVPSQKIVDLESVSGKEIEDALPLYDEIICWNNNGEFWSLSLEDWEIMPLIHAHDVVYKGGIMHYGREWGSSFFLYRDDMQLLHLYDFITREDTILEEPDGLQFIEELHMPCGCGRMLCIPWKDKEDTYLLLNADSCTFHCLEVPHPNTPPLHMWRKSAPDELVFRSDSNMDYYFYKIR